MVFMGRVPDRFIAFVVLGYVVNYSKQFCQKTQMANLSSDHESKSEHVAIHTGGIPDNPTHDGLRFLDPDWSCRKKEGQKARNSCLRLLPSLSADHVRFWPNRSVMLRRCLSRCLVSPVDCSQRGAS